MRDEDLDYARGLAMVTAGGVPDAVIRSAARLAPSTEAPALFGPGERERDGWTVDAAGTVWTPPDRDRPYQPVRSGLAEADVGSGEPSTVVPSSSRPTQRMDLGKQRARSGAALGLRAGTDAPGIGKVGALVYGPKAVAVALGPQGPLYRAGDSERVSGWGDFSPGRRDGRAAHL